jgi:hypothetical protein
MSFAPDFGLRLVRDGASPEMDIQLVPFTLDRISVVDKELFTTISNLVFDGEPHAVSLDFDGEILQVIKQLCPPKTARLIENELQNRFTQGHTLMLPRPLALAVTARLGEVQSAQFEDFLPLVVQSVSKIGRKTKGTTK